MFMDSKKLCFSRGFIEKFSETILILIPFLVKTFFVFLGGGVNIHFYAIYAKYYIFMLL